MKTILITLLLFIGCGNSNENHSTSRSVDLTKEDALFLVLDTANITYLEDVLKTASEKTINHIDEKGNTVLHEAAQHLNSAMKLLLGKVSEHLWNKPNNNGETPLQYMLQSNLSKELLKSADILFNNLDESSKNTLLTGTNSVDSNILHIAAENGHDNIVEWILQKNKIDVDSQNKREYTALMYASNYGRTAIVKMLIEARANINLKDKDGNTALHLAVNVDIATILIEAGVNINVQNNSKKTTVYDNILRAATATKHNDEYKNSLAIAQLLLKNDKIDLGINFNEDDKGFILYWFFGNNRYKYISFVIYYSLINSDIKLDKITSVIESDVLIMEAAKKIPDVTLITEKNVISLEKIIEKYLKENTNSQRTVDEYKDIISQMDNIYGKDIILEEINSLIDNKDISPK